MKLHNRSEGQTALAEINIIPLVDIMLVLLIIFMVAAPLLQQGVDIDLPEVDASAVSSAEDDFILSIDSNGKIFIGDDQDVNYNLENLEEKLNLIFENKKKKELYLHADKGVMYGYVVQIMAACQRVGIERVGMITAPEGEKSSANKGKKVKK